MTTPNTTNLKTRIEVMLEAHYEALDAGEIDNGVFSQWDRYIVESALECINKDGVWDKLMQDWKGANHDGISLMTWANALSEFKPPEVDSCWYD